MKIIDKYIYREFLTPFVYCFFAFMLLFIVGDLFENLDDFIQHQAPWMTVARYYLNMTPYIFVWTAPLAVLLSLLYQLGYMSKYNELSALKASGVSFWRISFPFGMIGVVLALALFGINERLVPPCTEEIASIRKEYIEKSQSGGKELSQVAFFSSANDMSFFINKIFPGENRAEDISIREFYPDGALKREWYAKNCRWLDDEWWLEDGYVRRLSRSGGFSGGAGTIENFKKQRIYVKILPQDIIRTNSEAESIGEQMNYSQLHRYLARTYTQETVPKKLIVDLYRKLSLPATILVVTIFGVAFGSKISKGGALASVGASIGFYLIYYGVSATLLALGKMEKLWPGLAVWTPQVVFAGIGGWLLTRVR